MLELIKSGTNFDFVGRRFIWAGLSIVFMVATVVLFFTKGLNYGIDFTGGAEVQIRVPKEWDTGKVRKALEGQLHDYRVQELIAEGPHSEYMIKAKGDESSLNKVEQQVRAAFAKDLTAETFQVLKVDVVGPAAGSSLRTSGFLSMFYALLCILIYVTIRFDMRYSPGAVLALLHDTMITVGVLILTQTQFDLQILAALLALIGYSNNDTIIVFDRVRETLHTQPKLSIEAAVNRAVNETLGRTILTSVSTFLSVFFLWLLGGAVIKDFAFTFMVGIIVGSYSSIFIASSLVIFMTHYFERRRVSEASGTKKKRKAVIIRPDPKVSA